MTTPAADPGWATTDDACPTTYTIDSDNLGRANMTWRCEGDPQHLERGEPHTITIAWFEPAADPDCTWCSDTGQFAGTPCPEKCAAWAQLHPTEAGGLPTYHPGPENAPQAPSDFRAGHWGDD